MSDTLQEEITPERVWRFIDGQLKFARHTPLAPRIREMREVIEWVMLHPELFQTVRSAHKAGVNIAQALEAALDAQAEHEAALRELERKAGVVDARSA